MIEVINQKSDKELVQSLVGEIAKAKNEISCAEADIRKAKGRLQFLIVVVNELLNRQGD
jgi:hypothetical protein